MPALTDESRIGFERGTEAFYENLYQPAMVISRRRRLKSGGIDLASFTTSVVVTDDEPNDDGNKIIYDQTIWVSTYSGDNISKVEAIELLTSPFEGNGNTKEEYLTFLTAEHDDFANVSEVLSPNVANQASGSGIAKGNISKIEESGVSRRTGAINLSSSSIALVLLVTSYFCWPP